jgi:hypothetical protein
MTSLKRVLTMLDLTPDMTTAILPWASLALLGAFHGINPGMGWLFAVALGLQERSRGAVLRALGPIALGHAVSIGVVATAVVALNLWADPSTLRVLAGLAVLSFGLYRVLLPAAHPRWVGMRVTGRDLAVWSFLMSTAHGAGLMLAPVLLSLSGGAAPDLAHAAHAGHAGGVAILAMPTGVAGLSAAGELLAVAVHTGAMLLVMAIVALLVFEKLGLAILRRAWLNVDRVWAFGLVGAGVVTLLL